MRWMIPILLAGAAGQEEKPTYFPLGKNFQWTYWFDSDDGKHKPWTWTLGEEKPVTFRNGENKPETVRARVLVGYAPVESYAVASREGVRIVTLRRIGIAGSPTLVLAADLRWGKDKSWKFRTMEGCLVKEVSCRQDGIETVAVGAKKLECLRIVNGKETFWLARGVGIVKRSVSWGGAGTVWKLTSYAVK